MEDQLQAEYDKALSNEYPGCTFEWDKDGNPCLIIPGELESKMAEIMEWAELLFAGKRRPGRVFRGSNGESGEVVMAKKKVETLYVNHCGYMHPVLHDGKARCAKCHHVFSDGKWSKPEKRDFRKRPISNGHTSGDMWLDLGILLVGIPPFVFFLGLWNNGIRSFRMDLFTLVVVLMLIGYVMVAGTRKKV